jgi:hypothetical protein
MEHQQGRKILKRIFDKQGFEFVKWTQSESGTKVNSHVGKVRPSSFITGKSTKEFKDNFWDRTSNWLAEPLPPHIH